MYLRLTEPEQSSEGTLIRANVDVSGSTIFVTFDLAEEGYPIIIDNRSDYAFTFRQIVSWSTGIFTVCHAERHVQASHPEDRIPQAEVYELAPHFQKPYTWDYPAAKDKKIVLVHEGRERVVDVMEIGDLVPWNLVSVTCFLSSVRPFTRFRIFRVAATIVSFLSMCARMGHDRYSRSATTLKS